MWDEEQIKQVASLLMNFNGADEVCAMTETNPDDLDKNALGAFGCTFEQAKAAFAARGRAMLRDALMTQAMSGNTKALEMLAREQLGMGAVEIRKKSFKGVDGDEEAGDGTDDDAILAAFIANATRPIT